MDRVVDSVVGCCDPSKNMYSRGQSTFIDPKMSHSTQSKLLLDTLQVSHHEGQKTCVKNGR